MSNKPEVSKVQRYIDQGLSRIEAEIAAACSFDLNPAQFQMHELLFAKGRTIEQIEQIMRDHPVGVLQAARAQFNWDKKRSEYRQAALSLVTDNMKADLAESMRYLGDYLGATHAEYQKALVQKIINPEREKMPSISKNEMDSYLNVTKFMRDTLNPPSANRSAGPNGTNPNANTLVSINIVGSQQTSVIETASKPIDITPDRAEQIRLARLKKAGMLPEDK